MPYIHPSSLIPHPCLEVMHAHSCSDFMQPPATAGDESAQQPPTINRSSTERQRSVECLLITEHRAPLIET
jgi:hypothetical protein